jgi:hypothetical protein
VRRFTLCLLLLALAAGPALAKGSKKFKRKLTPEFKYVDEADDAKAEKLLAPLVKKYATPAKCKALLKILRTKRPYPGRMPGRETLDFECSDGKRRQFTWILPSRYSKRKPTGVLFFLHGAIRQPPPGGGANEAVMFAPAVKKLNLIVVGPSTYEGVEWGTPACRGLVHHALDFVKMHFNVDENRVFIAGDSDGGRGTYALVESDATHFAAAVPVIGAPGGVRRFANLRNLPFFAINGETDGLFKIDQVRGIVERMQAAGIDMTFKVIEGKGHDPRFFLTYKDEVCAFLKKHPRNPFPKQVDWQVEDDDVGFPSNTFRWIRIEKTGSTSSRGEFDDPPRSLLGRGLARIHASYEGNRIEVQTSDVESYSVLISDEMLDLRNDVEIHTNGDLSFKGIVTPDAAAILQEARRFRDRKLVFSNRVTVRVDGDG